MFTGLIKKTAIINKKEKREGGYNFLLSKPQAWNDLEVGESISVEGICLTLEEFSQNGMQFFVGMETLAKTNFLNLKKDQTVNIERSLTLNDRLGGHMVSGHVDGTAIVVKSEFVGDCLSLSLRMDEKLRQWIIPKGSICINGVSLTLNEIKDDQIDLFLIPETLKMTSLKDLSIGDFVNIECDQMIKVMTEKLKDLYEHHSRTN